MALKGELEHLLTAFKAAGQEHVFKFWDKLNEEERAILLSEAKVIGSLEFLLTVFLESGSC
jgi:hypothetical protein